MAMQLPLIQETILDVYTRKVGGETFQYEAKYDDGNNATWSARVYLNGDLKGTPGGMLTDNTLRGNDLRQYVIGYIENIIERGLGLDE